MENKRKSVILALIVLSVLVLVGALYFLNQKFHFLADTNSPVTPPTCLTTVAVPSDIDSSGATDVSAALNSFLSTVSDSSKIEFKADGIYKINLAINLVNRHNLVFEGNGATLQGNIRTDATHIVFKDSLFSLSTDSDITIRNFKLKGSDSTNPGHYPSPLGEHQMGFYIYGGKNIEIHDVEISGVYGDGFYINNWSDNIYIHNNHVITADRNGATIIAGSNIIIQNNLFDKIGYFLFDIEPNSGTEGAKNIHFLNNTLGSAPGFFAADGNVLSVMSNVTVSGNTASQSFLGAYLSFRDPSVSAVTRRQNITFTNNTSKLPLDVSKTPLNFKTTLRFGSTDGVTVYGNVQPLTTGDTATITDFIDSTNVVTTPPSVEPPPPPPPMIESLLPICSPPPPVCLAPIDVSDSIDSIGTTDVSTTLISFLGTVPDGSIIKFKADGIYKLNSALKFSNRHNLIFEGNGATLKAGENETGTSVGDSLFFLSNDQSLSNSNITIRNFKLIGNSSTPGVYHPGVYQNESQEHQHGVAIRGGGNIEVYNVTVSNVWGDGFYITGGADNIDIHDNHVLSDGRNGASVIFGKNIVVQHNSFDKNGLVAFDVEPNGPSEGVSNVQFLNNQVGIYGLVFFAANGSKNSMIDKIIVSGNTVTGGTLSTHVNYRSLNTNVVDQPFTRRQNIVFTNNTSTTPANFGPEGVLRFNTIDGLTVYGNNQPLIGNTILTSINDCTNVITDPNIAITNTPPLTLKSLIEVCPVSPLLSSINLADGQIITTNPYIISVAAKDAAETLKIAKVEFYVDDNLIATSTLPDVSGRYQAVWDTSKYHSTVKVIAYGTNGTTTELTRNTTVQLSDNYQDQIITVLPNTGQSKNLIQSILGL